MKNKKNFKKQLIISIISAVLSFTLMISSTFAWFTNRYESDLYPEIEGASFLLNVDFGGSGSTVTLSSGLPVSDVDGYNMAGYGLTIENIGNIVINTNIKIELYTNDSIFTSDPDLNLFLPGQLRNALILKSYLYVDPEDPNNTSTTPNPDIWPTTETCVISSITYRCVVDEYDEDIYDFNIIPGEKYVFEIKMWIAEDVRFVNERAFFGRIIVETTQENAVIISSSDANYPILVQGMIPVIWDSTLEAWIIVQELDPSWYNYSTNPKLDGNNDQITLDRQWANVAVLSSNHAAKYMNCDSDTGCLFYPEMIGEAIPDEEIKSMFVWIPRFRYAVKQGIKNGSENQIDLAWEQGISERYLSTGRYNGNVATNYYTASAFKEVNRELYGFWIAKFQIGVDENEEIVSYADGQVKERLGSETWQDIIYNTYQDQGEIKFGLVHKGNDKSLQIKNSQWDAVAFLSQSQKGKYGKDGLPIIPNNNFSAGFDTTNKTTQLYVTSWGVVTQRDYNSEVKKKNEFLNIKSGYVCDKANVSACMAFTNPNDGVVGTGVRISTPQDLFGRSTVTYSRENSSDERINTSSVIYTDSVFGGRGSTTGNIYGVYDMAMGREELTATQYVKTGYYHASLPSLKTFAVPDVELGYVYVGEDGKVYNDLGIVIYESILASTILIRKEFMIKDEINFDMDTFLYFKNNYNSFIESGITYYIEKGSSIYLLDSLITKKSLYGAKIETDGDDFSFISRAGGLSGELVLDYQVTGTGEPLHDVVIVKTSSISPHNTNSGIFAQFSNRLPNFTYELKTTYFDLGDYVVAQSINISSSFNIYPSTRVVIVV